MSKARKGLEPGSVARVFRAGGGFGDSLGMYEVPDDGSALVIRDLAPGAYTARDELGNEIHLVQEHGAEDVRVRVKGAALEGVADVKDEEVSEDLRAPAAPGTSVVTEAPSDPTAGLPSVPDEIPDELLDSTQRAVRASAEGEDLRGRELDARARELDIEGRSSMSADEKREAIAEEEGGPAEVIVEPEDQPRRDADAALAAGEAEDVRASGAGGGRLEHGGGEEREREAEESA